MKKLLIFSVLACLSLIGCDKEDELIFLDVENGQNLVQFINRAEELPIVENSTGSVSVPVGVTTVSDVDRTFPISVDPSSTALPASYEIGNTVTIPAGEYVGFIEINGTDNNVEVTPRALILNLEPTGDIVLNERTSTIAVSIFQVCPLPDDFAVGDYDLVVTQSAGGFGFPIFRSPDSESSADRGKTRVTLTAASISQRTYLAIPRSGGTAQARTFTLNFICNSLNLADNVADPINPPLLYGPGRTASSYANTTDDSLFIVNFTGNVNGAFGGAPAQGTFELRKR
ncbi:hypothetical protein SAMN05192588_1734 [Nonlabens sp. Hel1_33_55]|uniref:DUF1735 domain-containing protein n=1 Tax=Nonlabens sp. Hel1_33_55 TaxID=1336802 RepID=UPI000875C462|nr:DUF1735 domain-containing protein [Nonlabens sp. Hel1_33_55]SCY22085.1 hypothetical protein SAMN05192588_1734 [Nonlabens sp. Hel1_33_55]